MSEADYWRNTMGAAMLRVARQKLRQEEAAGGAECEPLRQFIGGLDAHFGSGAIQAVAVNAEPTTPTRRRKAKAKLRIIKGGKGD